MDFSSDSNGDLDELASCGPIRSFIGTVEFPRDYYPVVMVASKATDGTKDRSYEEFIRGPNNEARADRSSRRSCVSDHSMRCRVGERVYPNRFMFHAKGGGDTCNSHPFQETRGILRNNRRNSKTFRVKNRSRDILYLSQVCLS
ncbi:hypothetical protein F2Q68_00034783 [Brassica cretica]|uniref:Uncharacterized protein n=1 Tax=Brassica cretica TaxID=69181 RepID=A0A8S9H8U2_BRACR|nr:hypothetical protein F2Q68_00034783 [Brassica cretica]